MSNDSGYGQIFPLADGGSDLNMIAAIARRVIERLDTMKLVKVVAVHPDTATPPNGGTVDVLPLVNQVDGNFTAVQHTTVFGVPVFRLQAGPWAIIADPAVGDYGFVVCADRDSSLVLKTPGQANPGSRRKYNIADGVYIGGIGSMNGAPQAYMWLKSDGTLNLTDKSGNVIQTSSNGIALTGNVAVTGNITATGEITRGQGGADQVTLGQHTHTQGVDSHGDTEQATNKPTAGT